jgi:hypothetical protein
MCTQGVAFGPQLLPNFCPTEPISGDLRRPQKTCEQRRRSHDTRIGEAHNPEVDRSNLSPATKGKPQVTTCGFSHEGTAAATRSTAAPCGPPRGERHTGGPIVRRPQCVRRTRSGVPRAGPSLEETVRSDSDTARKASPISRGLASAQATSPRDRIPTSSRPFTTGSRRT